MSLSRGHKQTLIVLIVCMLGVAIAGYAAYGDSLFDDDVSPPTERVTPAVSGSPVIPDSGSWRSQFLGTGSSSIAIPVAPPTDVPLEPETLTGQFGKKFFEQYMYLKQNNLSEDPQAIKALVDQTTGDLIDAAPTARVYDVREIVISQGSGATVDRAYANAIGTIFSTNMPAHDAAMVALQALDEEDQDKIKEVETIAAAYDTMLRSALSTAAPKSLAGLHTNLVNGLSAMSFASRGMTKVFSDPIQSIAALATYEKSLSQMRDALLDLKFAFSQAGLQFAADEPAIIFSLVK